MPKILKKSKKVSKRETKKSNGIVNVKKTIHTSLVLTGISLVVSFLLNSELIRVLMDQNLVLDIIDVSIKVSVILLFFLFLTISYSNYRELKGKPSDWKELVIISFLTLIQGFKNPWVFVFSLIGVVVLIIYLYLIQ